MVWKNSLNSSVGKANNKNDKNNPNPRSREMKIIFDISRPTTVLSLMKKLEFLKKKTKKLESFSKKAMKLEIFLNR